MVHPLFIKAGSLTGEIIAGAIEVHRDKGPGLLESIYDWCFLHELGLRQLKTTHQKHVTVTYKGASREEPLRFDLLVEECVLIECKCVERILPIRKAQLLSYMKLLHVPLGLPINFNVTKLTDGVSRLLLPGANQWILRSLCFLL